MNSTVLTDAIRFATDHEVNWSREIGPRWGIHQQERPPWNRLLGPVHDRGPVSGVILLRGEAVMQWGEPARADLTFSVAKTYLALLAGIAQDRGLITDVDEPVSRRLKGIGFDSPHNASITWAHLLQQTSEWEGECFGMPDQVERYRVVQFQTAKEGGNKGDPRPLRAPGSYWEYNDVRINQLSLALLHLFKQPLPEVFRDAIMRPIGASESWSWKGYDHAWIELDGKRMQSVPGGTHWGAGVSISAHDQALVGQLLLQEGRWKNAQVVPAPWIRRMRAPCAIAPFYGYLTWLNVGKRVFPNLPESSYFAFGAGGAFTWVEPERDMVVVVRWIEPEHVGEFFTQVLSALSARTDNT